MAERTHDVHIHLPDPGFCKALRKLKRLYRVVVRHEERINELETRMSATDDLVARLGAATDEIARDLQALADEVAGGDATVAAKFEPLVARLEAMGADEENPVPDAPEGDTPAE